MGSAFSTACLGAGGAAADLPFSGADETLGHSFCYLSNAGDQSFRFRSISGASVSANSATPPTVGLPPDLHRPFESTALFGVVPLLPAAAASGPLDRSAAAGLFLSGPIERGALSGPLDSSSSSSTVPFSAPLAPAPRPRRRRSFFRSFSVVPIRTIAAAGRKDHHHRRRRPAEFGENVQWAHGMAGEDRVQVVVSDDHRWLFVGIYDGFNGPDAPEFLMGNLYRSVFAELRGLLWVDQSEPSTSSSQPHHSPPQSSHLSADNGDDSVKRVTFSSNRAASRRGKTLWELLAEEAAEEEEDEGQGIDLSGSKRFAFSINCIHMPTKRRAPSFPNFRIVSSRRSDRVPLEDGKERLGQNFRKYKAGPVDHDAVLRALARGLAATEAAYLDMTDEFMDRNPELALMGSCLLVVLMRDEDVYVMNVGDSRAIVAQYHPHEMDSSCHAEGIVETMDCGDQAVVGLAALQLSTDHSTSIEEEVLRIRQEHPDDSQCIVNDRVKGRLKVTRAFGAGFLKQPKWNNGLLEMFRNDYIGTAPYLSCAPSLCHHKLGPNDQFLILSSDGLYQYLTNQEAASYVESFMERFPDGDPAQHLIEELLLRAAKKAGMDFHQLLDIPQGDRRKYHDDVTVMVISLEGRIWKSSGKYL